MEVLGLQVFVSAMLVLGSIVLYALSIKLGDGHHADRLSLLPLEDDQTSLEPAAKSNETERQGAHVEHRA